MESTERSQSSRSVPSTSHYYSGNKYFSTSNNIKHVDKYGSFTNNRKHFQNKLHKSSSLTSLNSSPLISSSNPNTNANTPFSQYTPDPYYNILSNEEISSMNINLDPNDFYINSKDDISIGSKEDLVDISDGDIEIDHEEAPGVHLIDSSSNCSFMSSTMSKPTGHCDTTSTSTEAIMHKIIRDNRESSHHPLLGMILVTLSAVLYAALNLSVKALMYETPWQELMFIRMFITWIATLIWMLVQYKGKLHLCGPSHQRLLLSVRAFFLWGAMFTCWWSFEFLPVGDGTTLAMSFPVWVSVFAHFVWKNDGGDGHNSNQRLDLFGWICVLAGLLGIAFVAQPSFIFGETEDNKTRHRDIGIMIGIASAMCAGAQYVIVNYTKKDCHWLQVEQMTAGLSTFVLCPLGAVSFALYNYQSNGNRFIIEWSNLNAVRWLEEIALGLLGFCALALLTRGSQLDAPARTAICLYLQIPFVYIGQCIMTKSFPDVYIFIGIFLVLCSVIIPAIRKLRKANKQKKLNEKLKQRRRKGLNHHDAALRKYSDDTIDGDEIDLDDDGIEETIPLIQQMDGHIGMGGVSGVTVDWSSDENSTGPRHSDIEDDYNDIDRAVL